LITYCNKFKCQDRYIHLDVFLKTESDKFREKIIDRIIVPLIKDCHRLNIDITKSMGRSIIHDIMSKDYSLEQISEIKSQIEEEILKWM